MTPFQIIRSHLKYGHKVEVRTQDNYAFTLISVNMEFPHCLVTDNGMVYRKEEIDSWESVSITPIPHRYKKLELGTRVDILSEYQTKYDSAGGVVGRYPKEEGIVQVDLSGDFYHGYCEEIPLWAITPHVEEEEKVKLRSLGLIDKYADSIQTCSPEGLMFVCGKVNELIKKVDNLQSTNN